MTRVEVDYVLTPDGKTVLEEEMIRRGWGDRIEWLVGQLQRLSSTDLLRDFNGWPLHGPEGQWGSIKIGPYCLQVQVYSPPSYEEKLGALTQLKVDTVGDEASILASLRDLVQRQNSAG